MHSSDDNDQSMQKSSDQFLSDFQDFSSPEEKENKEQYNSVTDQSENETTIKEEA